MIGRTNAGAGKSVALIRVLYPAGTTCTCSNGTITFGSDISGDYLFSIPSAGNWTVSGVDSKGTAKTITLAIARGDGKLVTIDTLIPPAYRATYQEVEYLRFYNSNSIFELGEIPLDVPIVVGSWDFELENLILDEPIASSWTVIGDAAGSMMLTNQNGILKLNSLIASETIPFSTPHNVKIHWSSVSSEAKPVSLTVDNEELASDTNVIIPYDASLYVGTPRNDYYCWYGKYGAVKVKNGGVLLHHYIPCKRRSDGMPGYFDLNSNEFKQGYRGQSGAYADVTQVINCGPGIGN